MELAILVLQDTLNQQKQQLADAEKRNHDDNAQGKEMRDKAIENLEKSISELKQAIFTLQVGPHLEIEPTIYNLIDFELKRAEEKHPDYPSDMFKQLAIIHEELGEVAKSVLQYHDEYGHIENIKKELIQTGAVCVRMLRNINDIITDNLNF